MRPWKGFSRIHSPGPSSWAQTGLVNPIQHYADCSLVLTPRICQAPSFVVCREYLRFLHSYHPPEEHSPHFFQCRKQSSEGISDLPKITQLFDSTHRDAFLTVIPTFCGRKREEGGSLKTGCKTSKQSLLSRS